MEKENDDIYISKSKENIDKYIYQNNYRSAFGLLLAVLEKLDDGKQKNDFIRHYLNDFFTMKSIDSHLNPR
jgi:hypothetical protein